MQRLRTRRVIVLALAALAIIPACLFFGGSEPRIQNHPEPDIFVEANGFDDAICPQQDGRQPCPPESVIGQLGCDEIRPTGNVLGGLRPIYPMRVCLFGRPGTATPPENEYVFREGCLLAHYVRYVVLKDGKYQLIASKDDLRQMYAPIENNLEALSYALASTGLGVRYGLQAEPGLRYFVDELQDTYVKQTVRGFQVHLYDYALCGCGPHSTFAVDLLISPDGQIEEIAREKVFEDPAEDEMCID